MPLSIPITGELKVISASKRFQGEDVYMDSQFALVVEGKTLHTINKNWKVAAGDEPFAKSLELMQAELDAPISEASAMPGPRP